LSVELTEQQKQLCNILQKGVAICERPFGEIAAAMEVEERVVLGEISNLKEKGVIKRIGPVLNWRALGWESTLVAAHVPQKKLVEVAKAVNLLEGVSHNYLREHHYNMWFTLLAKSMEEIESILAGLSSRFDVELHSLAARRVFKLGIYFDAKEEKRNAPVSIQESVDCAAVELGDVEKEVLSRLANDLPLVGNPFEFLCRGKLKKAEVLRVLQQLIEKGIIRRIGGIVDQRKLGFVANVLFAAEVGEEKLEETANVLTKSDLVSHCYERRTFDGWPYNLYAMMHAKNMDEIDKWIANKQIKCFKLLPTTAELKKQPVKYLLI